MASKFERLVRISQDVVQRPVPQIPKLPEFLKQKFPDHADEIEKYNAAWEAFFKRPNG